METPKFDAMLSDLGSCVNSLGWSSDGTHMLASSDDDSALTCSLDEFSNQWTLASTAHTSTHTTQTLSLTNTHLFCMHTLLQVEDGI